MGDNEQELKNKLLKGSMLTLLGNVAGMGAIFLARVLSARYLGPDEYGVLIIGLTLLEMSSILLLFGLPQGLGQRVPRVENPSSQLMASFLLTIPIGCVITFAGYAFIEPISVVLNVGGESRLLLLFFLILPLYLVTKVSLGFIRGKEDVLGRFLLQNTGLQILVVVGVGAVIQLGLGVYQIAVVWAGAFGGSALIAILYIRVRYNRILSPVDYATVMDLLKFSLPLMLSTAMWLILQQADNLLLGAYLSSTAVGIYDSAYTLARIILMLVSALGFLFLPILSGLDNDGKTSEMVGLYQSATKWLVFVGLVPLTLFVTYPGSVMQHVFGKSYVAGELTLLILSLGFFTHCLTGNSGHSLVAIGRTKIVAAGSLVAVVVNILLNLVLIPRFGTNGAASASAIAYMTVNIIYLLALYRESGIHPISSGLIRTVSAAGVVIVGLSVVPYQPSTLIEFIGVGVVEVLVIGGVIVAFGMNKSDWESVREALPTS